MARFGRLEQDRSSTGWQQVNRDEAGYVADVKLRLSMIGAFSLRSSGKSGIRESGATGYDRIHRFEPLRHALLATTAHARLKEDEVHLLQKAKVVLVAHITVGFLFS